MRFARDIVFSYLVGVAVSLGLFSLTLISFGYNPLLSIDTLATGSFGTVFATSETTVLMAPLLLSALAFLVAFRARFYNIGVEGQIYIGALTAYLAAAQLGGVPGVAAIPLVALVSFLGGTLWLAIPLLMRIKLQVNEIFPTLVMNFIAVNLINWLTTGPIKDPNSVNPQTPPIPSSTWLPVLVSNTRLNLGIIIAVLAAILLFYVIYKTVLGYEIRASGGNPRAATAGGVSVPKSILSVGLMSGGLAGLAGMVVLTGANHLLAQNFSPGYGYQGIGVAALGAFQPIGALLASVFYSALSLGGESMQRLPNGVPIELITVLQVSLVLSILLVQRWITGR